MCFLTYQQCVIYILLIFGKLIQLQRELYYHLNYLECDVQDHMIIQLTHHLKIETRKIYERCS